MCKTHTLQHFVDRYKCMAEKNKYIIKNQREQSCKTLNIRKPTPINETVVLDRAYFSVDFPTNEPACLIFNLLICVIL